MIILIIFLILTVLSILVCCFVAGSTPYDREAMMRRSWSFCVSIGSQKTGKEALKEQKYLRHAQSKAFFLHLIVEYNLALMEYSGMTQSWVRDNLPADIL